MGRNAVSRTESGGWELASEISREEMVATSGAVLATPNIAMQEREDLFRIRALDMDWDIGAMVYEPEDASRIPEGPDGKKIGVFLLHGGVSDYKDLEAVARMLAGKLGLKVASMTYPGRLYLLDPTRDWPGDTVNADGTCRTPIWKKDELITPDQYDLVRDASNTQVDASGKYYGTTFSLKAKEGTPFYYRLAAWPVAFEEAMKEVCRRHFGEEYAIYVHGHSTGGPFVHYLTQRVSNVKGLIGYGTGLFGHINHKIGMSWEFPFNYLRLRTWRDTARYAYEDLKSKNYTLPVMMEIVLDAWEQEKKRPNFKAEDFVHKNSVKSLEEAARVTARRLNTGDRETEELVQRYVGYCRELSGPGVKAVPPLLFVSASDDDTVTYESYGEVALPMFAVMKPAPKVRVVLLKAGVHLWSYVAKDLPQGVIPCVAKLWHEAIMNGYFLGDR